MDVYVLSQLINGVIFGLIYALVALGLTIIFGIMRVVNFAHGEFYMLGGYVLYFLTADVVAIFGGQLPGLGLTTFVGLPLSMAGVAMFGMLVERSLLRPVYTTQMERPVEYAIILTFGLSRFLQNAALVLVGPYEQTPQ